MERLSTPDIYKRNPRFVQYLQASLHGKSRRHAACCIPRLFFLSTTTSELSSHSMPPCYSHATAPPGYRQRFYKHERQALRENNRLIPLQVICVAPANFCTKQRQIQVHARQAPSEQNPQSIRVRSHFLTQSSPSQGRPLIPFPMFAIYTYRYSTRTDKDWGIRRRGVLRRSHQPADPGRRSYRDRNDG